VPVVLDASAYLAYTLDEPGATEVETAMVDEAIMSAVNLAEVLSRMADRMPRGARPPPLSALPGAVTIEPFTDMDALKVADLRFVARRLGLSLGDQLEPPHPAPPQAATGPPTISSPSSKPDRSGPYAPRFPRAQAARSSVTRWPSSRVRELLGL
jgi:ribonuclease VapC